MIQLLNRVGTLTIIVLIVLLSMAFYHIGKTRVKLA